MESILNTLRSSQEKSYPRTWNLAVHLTSQIIQRNSKNQELHETMENLTKSFEEAKDKAEKRYSLYRLANLKTAIEEKTQTLENLRQDKEGISSRLDSYDDDVNQIKQKIQDLQERKKAIQETNQQLQNSIDSADNEKTSFYQHNSNSVYQQKLVENQHLEKRVQQSDEFLNVLKQINDYSKLSSHPNLDLVPHIGPKADPMPAQARKIKTSNDVMSHRKSISAVHNKTTPPANHHPQRRKSVTPASAPFPSLPINEPVAEESGNDTQQQVGKKTHYPISAISFSKSGSYLATGDENGTINLYSTSEILLCSTSINKSVVALDFNNDDTKLLVAAYDTITILDIAPSKNRDFDLIPNGSKKLNKRAFNAIFVHSNQFVVCEQLSTMTLYEVKSHKKNSQINTVHHFKHQKSGTAVFVSQGDNGSLAAAYVDGTIRVWSTDSSMISEFPNVHKSDQTITQVHYYENLIISLSTDRTISIIDPFGTCDNIKKIYVTQCAITNRSKMVVRNGMIYIGADDGIYVYSIASLKFEKKMENENKQPIISLAANRDKLVSGDKTGILKRWE